MISRFASGITVRIDHPDLEVLKTILLNFLKKSDLKVLDEAIDLAVHYYDNDIRKLLGLANNIIMNATLTQKDFFNVDDIKEILDLQSSAPNDINKETYKVENLISAVAKMYSIKITDLTGKSRKNEIVIPRHIAMYILRKHFNLSLQVIGDFFSGRNHSTIKSAVDKIEKKINEEPDFSNTINQIIKKI